MLIARGWDPERQGVRAAGGRSAVWLSPVRAGGVHRARAPMTGRVALGLCDQCAKNYLGRLRGYKSVPLTLEEFKAMPMLRLAQADREEELCLVCRTPGHERPARLNGLCSECSRMRHDRRQTIEAFVNGDERYRPAWPRRTFGRCCGAGCRRWAITDERLCRPCRERWRKAARAEAAAVRAVHRRGAVAARV